MEYSDDYIKNVLKENGYKYTHQRAKIYEVFLNNRDSHLSTEDVFEHLKKDNPEIGIATVYRTLMLFEELGILYKISFDDGLIRYEIKSDDAVHRHHHLICTNCGKVIEFKLDLLDELEKKIEKAENFKIIDHNLKFYGYCEKCSNEKERINEK
ncbi:Fur family transcriptional regulator [Anaerosphaera multitolerans]|uniref:Transcriptional repressor n=1 Tax=Anaerosphaera multitolerans TaxID=2487351 RepID=A0A437S8H1_9FIRM|nr:Fur family transcriptional regulator [Anaerosphaera multitolerans]RVU55231.1 transcriptional repressor [Anaerosphaera multitolerans]